MKRVFILFSFFLGVSPLLTQTVNAKDRFFVSFYPLEYAVQFMVGDTVEVWNPVDSDPADWKPTKKQIAKIQSSRLIFINGAQFEKWPDIVSLPKSRLIETAKSFKKEWLIYKDTTAHRHGDEVHTHEGFDGHTWMSPKRFLIQLKSIHAAIAKVGVIDKNQLDQRYQKLRSQFLELDQLWQNAGKKLAATGFIFANHPAYNYLAKDYGFQVENFDFSPGEDFGASAKSKMVRKKKNHKGPFFWWESAPNQSQKKFIESYLKMKSLVLSPSEVRGSNDFFETMKKNVTQIK